MTRGVAALLVLGLVAGCVSLTSRQSAPVQAPPAPIVDEPGQPVRSSRGNPAFYDVFGRRYYVSTSSAGYREKGVASWYGTKFHGRLTSSGEPYDMYALTAAHKTLPLPTRVRVTNLRNGRSVVVMVNDRGPFVSNRLIDMSYAAARELDMINDGTAWVTVEALPYDGGSSMPPAEPSPQLIAASTESAATPDMPLMYLQVGAFGEPANAEQLKRRLLSDGIAKVRIHHDAGIQPALYRVRLGPIADVAEYDQLVQRVASLNIRDAHLVTEEPDGHPGG